MAKLYIANPDGPGVYEWEFKESPEWFQRALRRHDHYVWAGFLNGVQVQMARVRAQTALEAE